MIDKSGSSSFNYPGKVPSTRNSTNRELWLSKVVEVHVFKVGENSELFLFPSRLGSLILKPAAFKDAYLPLIAHPQLHNIEPLSTLKINFFL